MAARYVNPQNVAAQGQSFYTGLLPGSYDQGGGGRGNQSNVYGAGSGGGGGGGIPDRTGIDARSITDYKPKLSIDMRSRTGDKFKEWLKGPAEPTLVKLDGEVNPKAAKHSGALGVTEPDWSEPATSSGDIIDMEESEAGQWLVPQKKDVTHGFNPITNPPATSSVTRPNISLNPGPAYQSGSQGFTRQPGRTTTGLSGGSLQMPFPGMGKPAYTTTTGKPAGRTQTRRPNIAMNQSRPTQQQLF